MSIIIETNRIILREFIESDAPAVYAYNSNLEVQKYTGDELITSLERAKEIIRTISFKDYENYGYGRWAVVYKPDNKVIGFAGLKYLPEIGETDIGFRFLPKYWGKGIATEASKAIIQYGFEHLHLKRIIGIAMQKNLASNKVLQKIGLKLYKIDEYLGDGGKHNWYEITRS